MFYRRGVLLAFCALTLGCGSSAPSSTTPTAPTTPTPPAASTFALTGRVTDTNTGAALAGASITILDSTNASRTTTSDATGAFRLADLTPAGFTVRVRHDGYDSAFQGVNFVGDTSITPQLRPAMQSLSGTWAGTLSFTQPDGTRASVSIPQLTMSHSSNLVSSSTFQTAGSYGGSFEGALQDPSSIASTTGVMGTLTLTLTLIGRNIMTCKGTSNFAGTVNWTQMTITTPQIAFDCAVTYTNVSIALVRHQ